MNISVRNGLVVLVLGGAAASCGSRFEKREPGGAPSGEADAANGAEQEEEDSGRNAASVVADGGDERHQGGGRPGDETTAVVPGAGGSAGGEAPTGAGGGADRGSPLAFAAPVRYPGAAWIMDVGVADFDGDGALDVAAASFTHPQSGAFVWRNQGDGSLGAAAPYLPGEHATSIAVGDFNGDGMPDLVLTPSEGGVTLLLNDGQGAFPQTKPIAVQGESLSVRGFDANGDGELDIVSADTLFLNQGNGTFKSSSDNGAGRAIAAGDVDGDGKADLVYGGVNAFVRLNQGGGDFTERAAYPAGASAEGASIHATAVGDLNRDGWLDIAAAIDQDGSVSVLLNRGDGTFGSPRLYLAGAWPTSVAIGDLNGDGWPELVVANSGLGNSAVDRPHYVGVYGNRGDGTFSGPDLFLPVDFGYALSLADLDDDGRLDIVVGDGAGVDVVFNTTP